jgi:RHS repeat-associated protein
VDRVQTTMSYTPVVASDGNGWALHQPVTTIIDPTGLALKTVSRFDTAGRVLETSLPAAATTGGVGTDARSTDTVYYAAGATSGDSACNNKPQWIGLVCRTGPAAQPAGTPLPVSYTSAYNYLLQPLTATETSGTVVRTTTTTYDSAGRTKTSAVAVTGPTAPTAVHAKLQFEPPGAPTVAGYTADDGEPYTPTLGHGWIRQDSVTGTHTPLDLSQPGAQQSGVSWGNTRERNRTGISALQNTLIHLQYADTGATSGGQLTPGAFDYDVPNGRYTVTVSVGDQAYNSSHTINVEGVTAISNFVPDSTHEYATATVTVTVADGNLTVDAIGGTNTKLNYLTIDSATSNSNVAVPTITTGYDPATGLATTTGNGTTTITTGYDGWGRTTSTANATGDTATTSYNLDSQPVTVNDSKGTYTYTYNGTDSLGHTEHRGLVTRLDTGMGSLAGVFTGAYNADGTLTSQSYPTGILATTTVDDAGQPATLTYTKTGETWNTAFTASRDINGRIVHQTSPLSTQDFTYDTADRLTRTLDHPTGYGCTARSYGYDPDSNRTSLTTASYAPTGTSCGTPPTGTTITHTYDTADRDTDPGYAYDELGRTLLMPATDTTSPTGGTSTPAAITYDSNDMVAAQTSGPDTATWTTDPAGRLLAKTNVNIAGGGSTTTTTTNHYANGADSPAWIATTATAWTRNVHGLDGQLAAIQSSDGTAALQLTNLHGDVVATAADTTTATGTTAMFESTEFGAPRTTNTVNPTYGWLGAHQRSTDDLAGLTLMGARLYNPTTGRFLSIDPVPGWSANPYIYPTDPVNGFDLNGQWWHSIIKHWRGIAQVALMGGCVVASAGACLAASLVVAAASNIHHNSGNWSFNRTGFAVDAGLAVAGGGVGRWASGSWGESALQRIGQHETGTYFARHAAQQSVNWAHTGWNMAVNANIGGAGAAAGFGLHRYF